MANLFTLAKSNSIEDIKDFAKQSGLAPVRALHRWASVLSSSEVGVEIQWRKDDEVKGHLLLQPAEVAALKGLIDMTSDLEIDENDIPGTLHGFDDKSYMFRFEPNDGSTIIHGTFTKSAELPPKVTIPEAYTARVKTTTRVRYATEQPDISHELLALFERKKGGR
jgi:hypothetical protein